MTPVGLEPTLPKQGDFKSPVSANSTTGPTEAEGIIPPAVAMTNDE